jgi:branched-chain amino acid transport system substrate-binding protein
VAVLALVLSGCGGNRLSVAELRADAGIPDDSMRQTATDPGSAAAVPSTVPGAVGAPAAAPVAGAAATTTTPGVAAAKPSRTTPTGALGVPVAGKPAAAKAAGALAAAGTKPAATGGAATATAQCTGAKSTIVIGAVGQQSGPLGAALIGSTRAVEAWVARTDAAGGLGCHRIKYIAYDDGGDPARHLTLVRKLVEQDGAVAMVDQPALLTGNASADYVKNKGIPVIGTSGGEEMVYSSPVYFNAATSAAPLFDWTLAAGAKVAIPAGKTQLASIVCQEVVGCSTAGKEFKANAARLGFKLVYEAKASLINVDFTAQCIGAKNAGATAVGLSFDSTAIHRIAQSCASVGYFPQFICTSSQSTLDFAADKNLDGAVIGQPLLPWFLSGKPAIAEFQATMRRYEPGVPFDSSSINGWASAVLFSRATKAFAADTVTSKEILDALAAVKNDDLGGLTYPLSFSPGKPQPPKACGWVVQVKDTKFTSDGKLFCDDYQEAGG